MDDIISLEDLAWKLCSCHGDFDDGDIPGWLYAEVSGGSSSEVMMDITWESGEDKPPFPRQRFKLFLRRAEEE